MSDQIHVAFPPSGSMGVLQAFGLKGVEGLPGQCVYNLGEVVATLTSQGIDDETAIQLIRSYESKYGAPEDPGARINSFLKFIQKVKGKEPLLETIKNIGLLSKAELEEYAKETGDWSQFLRRIEKDRKEKT